MRAISGVLHPTLPTKLLRLQRSGWSLVSMAHSSSSAFEWLASFTNHERTGVPDAAGTDTDAGFDLGRMHRLLEALGSPQQQWPAVHVAGTKGKGSTVAMVSSILAASGYKIGSYTSPHIVSLNERLSINGAPISSEALESLLSRHAPKVDAVQRTEGGALTHFEVLTALAYQHFQEENVDAVVIETGLGGARDATNVLPTERLQAAIITAVGMDHAGALGGTIESIAAAKAGIMKPGKPVVLARQPEPAAEAVLLRHASELGCRVTRADHEVSYEPGVIKATHMRDGTAPASPIATSIQQESLMQLHGSVAEAFTSRNEEPLVELDVRLSLVGHHQLDNAATAIATAAHLKHSGAFEGITIDSIKQGLETAHLPGRFQIKRLSNSRKDALVVLDGAHTAESAAALAKTVKAAFPDAAIGLVVAMAADKDHAGFCAALRALSPVVVVFTEVAVAGGRARSAPPGVLAAAWQAASMAPVSGGRPVRTRQLIQASLTAAVAKADMELGAVTAPERVVVVCGSLHAVGAALNQLPLEP